MQSTRRVRGRVAHWHIACACGSVAFAIIYGALLSLAVLISERTRRTALSTAVLFLSVGYVVGPDCLSLLSFRATDASVQAVAELALFSVLFVEGCKVRLRDLREAWALPTRVVLIGMPLTMAGFAAAAHLVLGFGWTESALIGAILSPTDPVFAAAMLTQSRVPVRVRHLLGIESGVNDGLALPFVMVLFAFLMREPIHPLAIAGEVLGGVTLGFVIPAGLRALERSALFRVSTAYQPLFGIAVAILVLACAKQFHANEYLAAYAAGITLASRAPEHAESMSTVGDTLAEALKLAAVLAFACLLRLENVLELGWPGAVFVLIALLVVRPAATAFALLNRSLRPREWLAAAWFGPRGFASIVYGTLMVQRAIPHAPAMFDVIAAVTAVSIVAHSSTDLWVARAFPAEDRAGTESRTRVTGARAPRHIERADASERTMETHDDG